MKGIAGIIGMKIRIAKNGPYVVTGSVPLNEKIIKPKGGHYELKEGRILPQAPSYSLCRCGNSRNKPFCDGSHAKQGFDGTETASRESYEARAEVQEGPGINMLDDNRCAFARFCHRDEGSAWELTANSDDPHLRGEAVVAASECPAGRLTSYDKDGGPIEPKLDPAITVMQDPERKVSSGLYVQGGIPVESADGHTYEVRNRITLCRCGKSKNKPFCDATHVPTGFNDKK